MVPKCIAHMMLNNSRMYAVNTLIKPHDKYIGVCIKHVKFGNMSVHMICVHVMYALTPVMYVCACM